MLKIDGHEYSASILRKILHVASEISSFHNAAVALHVVGEIEISSRQVNAVREQRAANGSAAWRELRRSLLASAYDVLLCHLTRSSTPSLRRSTAMPPKKRGDDQHGHQQRPQAEIVGAARKPTDLSDDQASGKRFLDCGHAFVADERAFEVQFFELGQLNEMHNASVRDRRPVQAEPFQRQVLQVGQSRVSYSGFVDEKRAQSRQLAQVSQPFIADVRLIRPQHVNHPKEFELSQVIVLDRSLIEEDFVFVPIGTQSLQQRKSPKSRHLPVNENRYKRANYKEQLQPNK